MSSWLSVRFWSRRSRHPKSKTGDVQPKRRPSLESLEDRTLLSIRNTLSVLPAHPRPPSQPNAAAYVTGLYLDLLHRLPGAAEIFDPRHTKVPEELTPEAFARIETVEA